MSAAQRGQPAVAPARTPTRPPRLIVFLVVDQMRADYVSMYGHQWTKGLRRLLDTGAYFRWRRIRKLHVTCAGHATIGTGTYPATHGMIGNEWYDRDRQRSVPCAEDPALTSVPFGGRTGSEHHGPTRLAALTFADELKLQAIRPPIIVSMSQKARSAITFAAAEVRPPMRCGSRKPRGPGRRLRRTRPRPGPWSIPMSRRIP